LGEPYVLAFEIGRLHVVSESAPVPKPGSADKRGPPLQYHTVPDNFDSETAADIADQLEDEDWTDVTWSEGMKGDLTESFYQKRVRVCTNTSFVVLTKKRGG